MMAIKPYFFYLEDSGGGVSSCKISNIMLPVFLINAFVVGATHM